LEVTPVRRGMEPVPGPSFPAAADAVWEIVKRGGDAELPSKAHHITVPRLSRTLRFARDPHGWE
jgi:hypothetical protein